MDSNDQRTDNFKPPVLLIHGIRPDREWQELIGASLRHSFRPVAVTYSQYDAWYAFLLVFCEPALVALGLLVAGALWLAGAPAWTSWLAALAGAVLALLPPIVDRRRLAALSDYRRRAGDFLHSEPHVIAHSLGTYLTARLLTELKGHAFQRIILCGAVLDRNFDWRSLILNRQVRQVRNDYTMRDKVGWAGGAASLLVRRMGSVGKHGMGNRLSWVHRLQRPQEVCHVCCKGSCDRTIHDVDCSALGHSDLFLEPSHCRKYWLPFLWGIDPGEHRWLLATCRQWVEAVESLDRRATKAIERILQTSRCGWCHQKPVWEHLQWALHAKGLASTDMHVAQAFNRLAQRMHRATLCDFASPEARLLHPTMALATVVDGLAPKT